MDPETAKVLVGNLLERLSHEGSFFQLPGGRLSESEVGAIRSLAGIPPTAEEVMSVAPVSETIELDLGSLSREAPHESEIRLCLDFGTAMSKAWATGSAIENSFPLVLGREADGINLLAVPSSIFITRTGHVFFGAAAERQHEAEIHLGRHRFDNIKRLLSETNPGLDLDEVPLDNGIDPTDSGLTKGDLVVLYLSWLTDLALKALESAIREQAPELLGQYPSLRAARRRFAIPCFEHAIDDVPSSVRANWANAVMESALVRAQLVADTLGHSWADLNANKAKAVLRAVRATNLSTMKLFCASSSIREPIAAGATRFRDYIEGQDAPRARRLMLVIDAGAGTTDFALFQSLHDERKEQTLFALISKAVGMSRVAGNRFDMILRPLILRACSIHPENGSPWGDEEFSIIKADLSSQIRTLKQQLFDSGSVSISLRPGASGVLKLKELEDETSYRELGQNLMAQRDEVIRKAFTEEGIEAIKSINSRVGRAMPIHVLLTGGSSQVPLVKALASGRLGIDGGSFEFVEIRDLPLWVRSLPREMSEFIGREFMQCAVSLGGSAPDLPGEQSDFMSPILPPREGHRRLERFQVTGT